MFGGSCSNIVVLTSSLVAGKTKKKKKIRNIVDLLDMLRSLVSLVSYPHFGQGMGCPLVYFTPFLLTWSSQKQT